MSIYRTFEPISYPLLQITLDGKDEYLVNGDRIPPSLAHDLFRSVLLNVSRPHFLVRQGRVATVQNMKPHKILSMLVEATNIPVDDIEAAAKALEMKQIQIDEINELLH
ncbi:hypothetical protein NL676_016311 [Syzygium grande]|nr:hypothetical protein NL676_016311 [Syzygium grande]